MVMILSLAEKPQVTSSQVTLRGSEPAVLTDNSNLSVISSQILNSDEPTPRHEKSLSSDITFGSDITGQNQPVAKRTWKKLSMNLIKKKNAADVIGYYLPTCLAHSPEAPLAVSVSDCVFCSFSSSWFSTFFSLFSTRISTLQKPSYNCYNLSSTFTFLQYPIKKILVTVIIGQDWTEELSFYKIGTDNFFLANISWFNFTSCLTLPLPSLSYNRILKPFFC